MFERFLKFFVENSRINYTLFILVFIVGIYSYNKLPKEIFPNFDLDVIEISGSYSGASVDILDKMAVKDIEDEIKNIDGVSELTSVISPGKFTIVAELKKGSNRFDIANKIKDNVDIVKQNFPSDMDTPSVVIQDRKRDLLNISLTSNELSIANLIPISDIIRTKILSVKDVSEVNIFGDSDLYYEIIIDEKKADGLNINKNTLYDTISSLSYIFPIGKIEGEKHFFLSTKNGPKSAKEFENTLININNISVYLKDIAKIEKRYEDSLTLYSYNTKDALSISVVQNTKGDALTIKQDIEKLLVEINKEYKNINIEISDDNSERIRDRLNIVVSNILLGIILITVLVGFLINTRMAFIIALGIPTSFVMGSLVFLVFGYTINMISLVGVLIAIGIVVDDAIVVSENIQQHLEEGHSPKEAAIMGAKEMAMPVFIASITTLFSFIPALLISGTMGEVMKLVPIALSTLVIASLIESFLFLPIHAAHTLKSDAKVLSWEKVNNYYSKVIHFFMNYKKTFLFLFLVLVPLFTVLSIKNSRFQMFPTFDSTDIKITLKANVNTKLEDSFKIVQDIEKDILNHKDEFYIKSIDSVAGFRRDNAGNSERNSYVMYMTLELYNLKADNFIDKYITPYLSFYYKDEGRIREKKSQIISEELRKFLLSQNYEKKYNLQEISIVEKKVGPIKSDIAIGIIGHNNQTIIEYINKITTKLKSINGTNSVAHTATFGADEIKLEINEYGQKLGVTEQYLGSYLSNLYLEKKKSLGFDDKELLEIKTQSVYKDNFESFKDLEIQLNDGKLVRLSEVANFHIIKSFEKLTKDMGEKNFYIYANVNPKTITATEVLKELEPILEEGKNKGLKFTLKGEEEKKKELKSDMLAATALALTLIMLAMLYLFNSFRDTFIVMSVIPFSFLGVLIGHELMGLNLSMPSFIGGLGLAGVVINDGIIMMTYLKKAKTLSEVYYRASKRFRPIILTSITTLIGMTSLIFFPTGQAVIFQPLAIALGFGLAWGTVLNLIYLPVLYSFLNKIK